MPALKRAAYAAVDTLTLRAADAIVAVSEDGRGRLLARRALDRSEILLIKNGVDVDNYRPREGAKARLLAEVGRTGDAPTIGMVAQLTDDKGWDVFLETVLLVKRAVPDLAAFVVGGGPRTSEISLSVAHTKLAGTVFLLGHRSDVQEVLPAFDVVVHTSRREGLPLIVIEAMASGRPVVASDAGGTAELIVPGVTGHVVPVGDSPATADRVIALLGDPSARRRMGIAGRERAVGEFTLDRMVSEYQTLYERMARRRGIAGGGTA
jgi:glycosyltransferase involved in cell wall biosynthesis